MRLRHFFVEEQIKGNRRRREAEGLPWLEYHATQHEIGAAVMAAEKITGRTIRVGLWSNSPTGRMAPMQFEHDGRRVVRVGDRKNLGQIWDTRPQKPARTHRRGGVGRGR